MPDQRLKTILIATIVGVGFSLGVGAAIAQIPFCYRTTSQGETVDLTNLCSASQITGAAAIAATNLKLEIADEEFLSSRIKATVTNRSEEPVAVSMVWFRIKHAGKPLTTVSVAMNRTLSPGQSVPVSEIFDKGDLQGQDPASLDVSFQGWQ
ncbi:MAG: hypothetical protein HC835_11140 [Oscillatoriales cyanobacterium RM2_1_1]|nr:hypothetical protein [Oscillatoriales cyanobacterium SM2_3_0]NJO46129.1 hypothetical protein [Oscillatoriales cyanobacterium RM2_1_1]